MFRSLSIRAAGALWGAITAYHRRKWKQTFWDEIFLIYFLHTDVMCRFESLDDQIEFLCYSIGHNTPTFVKYEALVIIQQY